MLKAIIVDDELGARETLTAMLNKFCPDIQVLATAESAPAGVRIIEEFKPDIVFLDVRMPVQSGFELLHALKERSFHVIFTTAYVDYAVRAIKYSALDYLLKPINPKELVEAVKKCRNTEHHEERFEVFSDHQKDEGGEKIVLPHKDGFRIVYFKEIVRFEGSRNYSWVYLISGEKILVSKTLRYFEDLLVLKGFMRVHQSHLINKSCVRSYFSGRGGTVELIDGSSVPIARSRKKEFVQEFKPE